MPDWLSAPTSLSTGARRSDPRGRRPLVAGGCSATALLHALDPASSRGVTRLPKAAIAFVADALLRFRPMIGTSFEMPFPAR